MIVLLKFKEVDIILTDTYLSLEYLLLYNLNGKWVKKEKKRSLRKADKNFNFYILYCCSAFEL